MDGSRHRAHHHGMWTGLVILLGVGIAVGVGQWWLTRPTSRRPIDTSGRADAAEFDNEVVRGQGLPPY
ncbi:MAG: hypothetical protein JWP11_1196 [Frankiales bacterium]|jgi:hypothetical protein|nr:hypothetical protein [Frankiales bacterium]